MSTGYKHRGAKKGEMVGKIELGRILGVGGFGQVRLGVDREKDKPVAVKVIDKHLVKQHKLESYVKREIEMLSKIKHEHVVRLLNFVETSKGYFLVMELAPNGELFDKIVESKRFDEETARKYFQQMMSAIWYCHSKEIVHRDLKAENLLLGPNNDLKVCDFGLSRYVVEQKSKDHPILFTSLAGSTDYQAPEVIKTDGYHGFTCDVWSCGVILFFMLCGYLPFAAHSDKETQQRILQGAYNKRDKHMTPEAQDLIMRILVVDPKARYSTADVIAHPWFQKDLDMSLFPDNGPLSPMTPVRNREQSGFFVDQTGSPSPDAGSPRVQREPHAETIALLKQAFESCDIDKSGALHKWEIRDVMIKMNNNEPVTDEALDKFFSTFQTDADGCITEEQFVTGWLQNEHICESQLELRRLVGIFHYEVERELLLEFRKAFDSLDVDKSGIITPENIMSIPQLSVSREEANRLIDTMDLTKTCASGLTFEDFIQLMTKCDLLQRHPLGVRLNRVGEMFDVFEFSSLRQLLSTGFTVAGLREIIHDKLINKAKTEIGTTFRDSEDALIQTGTPMYLYGSFEDEQHRKLEMGVQLLPAVVGYTKVMAYRIGGKTEVFHKWFLMFRKLLKAEIMQVHEDTMPVGEAELM